MVFYTEATFNKPSEEIISSMDLSFIDDRTTDIQEFTINILWFKLKAYKELIFYKKFDNYLIFINNGLKLPFPFILWKSTYIICPDDEYETIVKDKIEYKTKYFLLDCVLLPLLMMTQYYIKLKRFK